MYKHAETKAAKTKLRLYYKSLRANADKMSVAADKALCENLFTLPCFCVAKTILMYYPAKGESEILPIFEKSKAEDKVTGFPLCIGNTMIFKTVSDLTTLALSAFGIPEPSPLADTAEIAEDTVCIVPALAFDRKGFRLGYGGGYYDRFLTDFSGTAIGLCRSEFLTNSLPHDNFDKKVDIIITEKEVVVINEEKKLN